MSGVAVIRYMLANSGPVTAVVPATNIMAGDVPLKTVLPAISVVQISGMPMNMVTGDNAINTDRVQVTVLFKRSQGAPQGGDYPAMRAMLRLVLAACPHTRGTVNSVSVDSVLPDFEGPDFFDEELNIVSGSRDFIVKWHT